MATARDRVNLLDVVPLRSQHVITEQEGDCIVIAFPRFKYAWMRRFLLPKGMSAHIRVRLEEHGSAVWQQIDGKRTVREIIDSLGDYFAHEENYQSRITTYLMQLQKEGFIRLLLCQP